MLYYKNTHTDENDTYFYRRLLLLEQQKHQILFEYISAKKEKKMCQEMVNIDYFDIIASQIYESQWSDEINETINRTYDDVMAMAELVGFFVMVTVGVGVASVEREEN